MRMTAFVIVAIIAVSMCTTKWPSYSLFFQMIRDSWFFRIDGYTELMVDQRAIHYGSKTDSIMKCTVNALLSKEIQDEKWMPDG